MSAGAREVGGDPAGVQSGVLPARAGLGWFPAVRSLSVVPGPVVRRAQLRHLASRAAGGNDHLAAIVTLPATAGDEFSGLRSELVLTFTGVQRAGNR